MKEMKNKDIDKTIFFSSPADPRTGFMSNSSRFGFVLGSKRWHTVEHYISAKKFAGTLYEDTIRLAPTLYQVRRLVKEKKILQKDEMGNLRKISVYGAHNNYYLREDWEDVELDMYQKGMRAKFAQHTHLQKKLLNTGDAKLVDETDKLVGPILEKIRSSLVPSKKKEKMALQKIVDFSHDKLNSKEKKMLSSLIIVLWRIARKEGWGKEKTFPEMIPDAIRNAINKPLLSKNALSFISQVEAMSWSDIYRKLPRFEKIISEVHEIYLNSDPTQINIKGSLTLAIFVLWYSLLPSSKAIYVFKRLTKAKSLPIVIGPGQRAYRNLLPPHPVRKKPKSKVEKSPVITDEKKATPSRIEVVVGDSSFYIWGTPLSKPEIQFRYIVLGGLLDRNKITFPLSSLSKVKKAIVNSSFGSEKYHLAHREWVKKTINDLTLSARSVAKLKKTKQINSELMKFVIEKLYLCSISKQKVHFDYSSFALIDKNFSKGARKVLFLGIDSLSRKCVTEKEAEDYVLGRKTPSRNIFYSIPQDFEMEKMTIKVLQHIQTQLCEYTALPLNKTIYECSVRILTGKYARLQHILKEILNSRSDDDINKIIAQYLSSNKLLRAKVCQLSNELVCEQTNHVLL